MKDAQYFKYRGIYQQNKNHYNLETLSEFKDEVLSFVQENDLMFGEKESFADLLIDIENDMDLLKDFDLLLKLKKIHTRITKEQKIRRNNFFK